MEKRILCLNGCGRFVLAKLGGECRKCRRQRVQRGKRAFITKKGNRINSIVKLVSRTSKAIYDAYKHVQGLSVPYSKDKIG